MLFCPDAGAFCNLKFYSGHMEAPCRWWLWCTVRSQSIHPSWMVILCPMAVLITISVLLSPVLRLILRTKVPTPNLSVLGLMNCTISPGMRSPSLIIGDHPGIDHMTGRDCSCRPFPLCACNVSWDRVLPGCRMCLWSVPGLVKDQLVLDLLMLYSFISILCLCAPF